MFCPKCGANLVDGADFCQKCGAQVKKPAEAEPQQQPQAYAQQEYVAAAAPKRSKAPIIIAVCAAVVAVIIIAAVAIPAIMRHKQDVWEEKVENVLNEVKEYRPIDAEKGQERWQTSDTPTYAEVFDYAINSTWEVTDPNAREVEADGVASYTNEEVHIYFRDDLTTPYKIECGNHSFGYGDITTFINDMFDAYMNNDEFVPLTVPKFLGRIKGNTYENKYLGFKLTLPESDDIYWAFLSDEELKEYGLPTKDDIKDLTNLRSGDYFVDAVAGSDQAGVADIGIHTEYLSSYRNDFDNDDKFIDDSILWTIEQSGCSSYQIDEEESVIGDLRYKTFWLEINADVDDHYYRKYYYAIKDNMLFQIQMNASELSDFAMLESMFSPI